MMQGCERMSRIGLALGVVLALACGQQEQEQGQEQEGAASGGQSAEGGSQPEPRLSARHASDAHAYVYRNKLVLVTSEDLDMGPITYPYDIGPNGPRQNIFPMKTTWVHYLNPGSSPQMTGNWYEKAILEESNIPWMEFRDYKPPTYHLWGPDMALSSAGPGSMAMYHLYAPDLPWQETAHSRVGMFQAKASPYGTFESQGKVTIDGVEFGPTGYVSDPNVLTVVSEGRIPYTSRYFLWADGDFNTEGIACGGISIGNLAADMKTVTNAHQININNLPLITDTSSLCYERSVRAQLGDYGVKVPRPYIESPALYYFTKEKDGVDSGDMPYYLVFPVNFDNGFQSLAYARASNPMGDFEYQGVILTPGNEWTTHGSLVKWGGDWLLFYHERDTNADGLGRDRMVHATCLAFDGYGNIKRQNGESLPIDRGSYLSRDLVNGYGINCAKNYGVSLVLTTSRAAKDASGNVISVDASFTGTLSDGQKFSCGPNSVCNWILPLNGSVSVSTDCPKDKRSWTGCSSTRENGCTVTGLQHGKQVKLTCRP